MVIFEVGSSSVLVFSWVGLRMRVASSLVFMMVCLGLLLVSARGCALFIWFLMVVFGMCLIFGWLILWLLLVWLRVLMCVGLWGSVFVGVGWC